VYLYVLNAWIYKNSIIVSEMQTLLCTVWSMVQLQQIVVLFYTNPNTGYKTLPYLCMREEHDIEKFAGSFTRTRGNLKSLSPWVQSVVLNF
jgi:hypothetical protein